MARNTSVSLGEPPPSWMSRSNPGGMRLLEREEAQYTRLRALIAEGISDIGANRVSEKIPIRWIGAISLLRLTRRLTNNPGIPACKVRSFHG